ncbi:MAG: hypothetical protein EXR79_02300 [Myxococcales bacterium]|nr:hypothetical protein [Myxococcales bacterium]
MFAVVCWLGSALALPLPAGVTPMSVEVAGEAGSPAVAAAITVLGDPVTSASLADAYLQAGLDLQRRRQFDAAAAAVGIAWALRPNDAAACEALAAIHDARHESAPAEWWFLRAILLDGRRASARQHYAEFLVGRLDEAAPGRDVRADAAAAVAHLQAANTLPDHDAALVCSLGRALALARRCADAAAAVEACLRLPTRKAPRRRPADLHVAVGDCHFADGDFAEADAAFQRAGAAGFAVSARLDAVRAARDRIRIEPGPEHEGVDQRARDLALRAIAALDGLGERRTADATSPALNPAAGGAAPLTPNGSARAQEAVRLATTLIGAALRLAPESGLVQFARAESLVAAGAQADAELPFARALALGLPDDRWTARAAASLGRLYLRWGDGARSAQAAVLLDDAVRLEPTRADLRWDLIDAHRKAGQLRPALHHLDRWLRREDAGTADQRRDALALRRALQAAVGPADSASNGSLPVGPAAAATVAALREARRLAADDRYRDAADALRRHLRTARAAPALWNELALYVEALGDPRGALDARLRSLAVDAAQPDVQLAVGRARLHANEVTLARRHLLEAERLGVADATIQLVRLDVPAEPGLLGWRDVRRTALLAGLRQRLDGALTRSDARVPRRDTPLGRSLRASLDGRLAVARAWQVLALLLVACGAAVLAWWRWGGLDLKHFLDDHPGAGADVVRVLAAIRHEVLKHNTVALEGLAEALERGLPEAADQASHVRRTLLGGGVEAAVVDRLHGYVRELQLIARAHGERLNPRRDRALRALLRGFGLVGAQRRALGQVDALRASGRLALAAALRRAARWLNAEAWAAVTDLLDELRRLRVDAALLQRVFARTRAEPDLAALAVAPLDLDAASDLPVWVDVPRAAFDDVLTNLFRNAIQAGTALEPDAMNGGGTGARGPVRVGVGVHFEVDPITGLEGVAVAVKDCAPGDLDDARIRSAPVERGLGLCRDLVERHEGSLDVRPEPAPWRKALVVRLPRADPPAAAGGRT